MNPCFIGRQRELATLEQAYASPRSEFWPVYGRRRIGKTELIKQFLKKHPGLYFLGKQAPAAMQLREFLRTAADAVGEPLLASQAVNDWSTALQMVVDRWPGPEKLVLAIDEFQWAAGASPELPSVIQGLWDGEWANSGKVFLILCGSDVGFMEREVLGRSSPLFGRRTGQIQLQTFGYREAGEFHPRYSERDRALAYFVCGGVPFYLKQFDDGRSIEANIAAAVLDPYAPLHREPEFLLREELREVERYHGILMAIATGDTTAQAIAARTGLDVRQLPYYAQQLEEIGYVRRARPLTPRDVTSRSIRYRLSDPLLRFWFRHMFPQQSSIVRLGPARAMRELIKPNLPAYWGLCFEDLCREALPDLLAREGFAGEVTTGEYWDRHMQIDAVGLRDDGRIELAECKWGAVRSPRKVLDELAVRAASYPNPNNESVALRVFTRLKVKSVQHESRAVVWHTLADIYGA